MPTILSLLTPEYQQRMVQEAYHYCGQQRAAVAGSVLLARRLHAPLAQYGGGRINLVVTPDLVLDMRNAAKTLITNIHIGREFKQDGSGLPRLGPTCRGGTARRSASGTTTR